MTTTSETAAPEAATRPPGRGAPLPRALWVVVVVLLVAALACAAVFGTRWALAAFGSGGGSSSADQRDAALADANQDAINLTTIDSSDVDGTLASWNKVVTGDLATQFASTRSQLQQQIASNPGTTSSRVVGSALSALDPQAGTATAVIFVDVTTTSGAETEQPQERRFALSMAVQRTDSGWKASGLQSLAQNTTQ